jgi:hypothetical protein
LPTAKADGCTPLFVRTLRVYTIVVVLAGGWVWSFRVVVVHPGLSLSLFSCFGFAAAAMAGSSSGSSSVSSLNLFLFFVENLSVNAVCE